MDPVSAYPHHSDITPGEATWKINPWAKPWTHPTSTCQHAMKRQAGMWLAVEHFPMPSREEFLRRRENWGVRGRVHRWVVIVADNL